MMNIHKVKPKEIFDNAGVWFVMDEPKMSKISAALYNRARYHKQKINVEFRRCFLVDTERQTIQPVTMVKKSD